MAKAAATVGVMAAAKVVVRAVAMVVRRSGMDPRYAPANG